MSTQTAQPTPGPKTPDQPSQPPAVVTVTLPVEEAYRLTELKILTSLEQRLFEDVQGRLKKWAIWFSVIAFLAALFGLTNVWTWVKASVGSAVASEVKERLEAELPRLQTRIDDTWVAGIRAKEASERAVQTLDGITKDVGKFEEGLKQLRTEADTAKVDGQDIQNRLTEQSNHVARLELILRNFFSNSKAETINVAPTNLFPLIPLAGGKTLVCFPLESIPLENSLRLQWHVYAQPPSSFFNVRNVVFFVWGEPAANLITRPIYAQYVADPTATNAVRKVEFRDDKVYGDGQQISDVSGALPKATPP